MEKAVHFKNPFSPQILNRVKFTTMSINLFMIVSHPVLCAMSIYSCLTYITFNTFKEIHYFVTCELSDVTMSTMCMSIICTN